MAAHFNLTRKSAPDAGPVNLYDLDAEICALIGEPVHPSRYCIGWFDSIGYWLAVGKTWDEIRTMHAERAACLLPADGLWNPEAVAAHHAFYDRLEKVRAWLEENFIPEHWYKPCRP